MTSYWNHVTVRDGRVRRDHPRSGEVLTEFDADEALELDSVIVLPDNVEAQVIWIDHQRSWEDDGETRLEQVVTVGEVWSDGP